MILGTAGHIDHGKTTLVRALSGVDTDRLKEEKARGISIELGYAYMPVPPQPGAPAAGDDADAAQQVLGIIDVPGHEKFVHTMAAGASGIDHALLVVAADDGVMPQTREHLAIALLFGIRQGTLVLTKCDRADAARIAAVKAEVAALLVGTPLAGAPIFETAIAPGFAPLPPGERLGEGQHADDASQQGVQALRNHLFALARQQHARRRDGLFRLAVDRVFTLAGHGTVVTGTVFGGQVRVGEALTHSASGQTVRVRSLHAQNRAAEQGSAGQRVALNLTGLSKEAIARGDWIADARVLQSATRIDIRLRLLPDAPALTAWTPLHVHLGAAHRQAHAVTLQGDSMAPGTEAWVQLVLDAGVPMFVVPGDRLILRNAQGTRTVGGGVVLDAQAPERRRRSAERMQWLAAMDALVVNAGEHGRTDDDALRALLDAAPAGLTRSGLARLLGRLPAPDWAGAEVPVFALGQPGIVGGTASTADIGGSADLLWLSPAAWAQVRERVLGALERHHARAPDEPGLNSARLQRMAFPSSAAALQWAPGSSSASSSSRLSAQAGLPGWAAWLAQLVEEGAIARTGHWLHLPGHSVSLNEAERALADRLLPLLAEGGNDPPWVRDLAKASATREDAVRELLRKLARTGQLYQVVKDLFYPAERIAQLAAAVARLAAQAHVDQQAATRMPARRGALPPGAVEARLFRDATELGRKRAIQILEFFDRVGYTRRVGDAHLVRPHTHWSAEGPVTGSGDASTANAAGTPAAPSSS
ncbi:SelB C-terminal domain-containing protein [Xenophilus arseniciresistens]|uniref:SelB C-terminal domain-containing protein n=1 Tax=Xenophilus arseniciresistens TaxID=1283306 RepID=A0AAE3N870_9BURK|nr:SelB C-terminal domain-containing protein [Xenophilus arseniciresistens]MDA7416663.1 SelB C-terminal domain-containing protein [Xenophilus arseniciresistens]